MNLRRAGLSQKLHDAHGGGAPNDGIVHQHHALPLYRGGNGVQFDAHLHFAAFLGGLNEGAADVLVFQKADAIGNAGGAGVANGRVNAAVRHAHHHVRLHRMFQGEKTPGPLPRPVYAGAVQNGIGSGNIDEFKGAQGFGTFAHVAFVGMHAVFVHHHDFAGFYVPHEGGAYAVQGAGFGSKDDAAAIHLAHAQGAEAVGIPHGDELGGGKNHQRIRALQPVHGPGNGLFDGSGLQPFPNDTVGNDFRIAGHVENRPRQFQLFPQFAGVGQRAVVGHGHEPLDVVDHNGLGVLPGIEAGGAVSHVGDGQIPLAQAAKIFRGKYVVDQARVLVTAHEPVLIDHDARALLAPVLQGKKAVITHRRNVENVRTVYAEHAAFLVKIAHKCRSRAQLPAHVLIGCRENSRVRFRLHYSIAPETRQENMRPKECQKQI